MINDRVGLVSLLGEEHVSARRTNVFNDTEPLGLLCIGGIAERLGHEVKIFHPYQRSNSSEKSIIEGIVSYQPTVLGISSMTNTFPRSMRLIGKIKSALPEVKMVVGGDHISTNPLDVENFPSIDIAVMGEGEDTFKEILEGRNLEQINGIAYLDNGTLRINSRRGREKDRSKFPVPLRDREILTYSKVGTLMYPALSKQTGAASLLFQFGCPFGCAYCNSTAVYGSEVTSTSTDQVIKEMRELENRFGINTAFFTDLTFNLNPDKSEKLCRRIEKENLGISWYAIIRPTGPMNRSFVKDSTLEAMAKGGCTKIGFGIES